MNDLNITLKREFDKDSNQSVPETANLTPPPSSLSSAKQVWVDAGTTLYFLDKPYIRITQIQEFDVLKYDPIKRRVYVSYHDAQGSPIALNVSENQVGK